MRVVSLIASATEMVCALGCEALLVGRSHECDHPSTVLSLPPLTEPKFPTDGASAQIDERIREILRSALSVYRVYPEKLDAVRPDVIITQSQCQVCAVSQRDVDEAVAQLVASKPKVVSLSPNSLDDIWRDIRAVADALKVGERGEKLVAELQSKMAAIANRSASLPRRSIACIEWIEPLMAAGNWMPSLCDMAGADALFGEANRHSPWMEYRDLQARDPDIIVVLPCGFDIPRTRSEMAALTARPGWQNLRAVQAGEVYLADGNQYFNRPGPRIVESLEILAEIVHPQTFDFGHRDCGFIRY